MPRVQLSITGFIMKDGRPTGERLASFSSGANNSTSSSSAAITPTSAVKRLELTPSQKERMERNRSKAMAKLSARKLKRKLSDMYSTESKEEGSPEKENHLGSMQINHKKKQRRSLVEDDLSARSEQLWTPERGMQARKLAKQAQKTAQSARSKNESRNDVRKEQWYLHQRDAEKRRPCDPGFNPRTLFVPDSALKKFTDAHRQYWELRRSYNDGIFLFKIGKFYEIFHKDAEIAHELCNLRWMGDFDEIAHVGFPEHAFERYARQLLEAGYVVYRIEQTETPEELAERKKLDRSAKCVSREVCAVLTKGTVTNDCESCLSADHGYLMAIFEERQSSERSLLDCRIAVAFVDVATHELNLGSFTDDRSRSWLKTLLTQTKPNRVLILKSELNPQTLTAINRQMSIKKSVISVNPEDRYDANQCALRLTKEYFDDNVGNNNNKQQMPEVLSELKSDDLIFNCLGLLIRELEWAQLAGSVLPNAQWLKYSSSSSSNSNHQSNQTRMILDGQTLKNLHIFENDAGKEENTLFAFVNRTKTMFGRRMLRRWLEAPLMRISEINERLDSVEFLMDEQHSDSVGLLARLIREQCGKFDLKRKLGQISALSTHGRPMDKAVLFSDASKKANTLTFCKLLNVLEKLQDIPELFDDDQISQFPNGLRRLLCFEHGGYFPEYRTLISSLRARFDLASAMQTGVMIPEEGADEEYDAKLAEIDSVKKELDECLDRAREIVGTSKIEWKHARGKHNCYQLEFAKKWDTERIPEEWKSLKGTKSVSRYHNPEILELIPRLRQAEFERDCVLKDHARKVFAEFSSHCALWSRLVECVSELDCLLSLAHVSCLAVGDQPMSRPIFVDDDENDGDNKRGPLIELRDSCHPCLTSGIRNFIRNDVLVGGDHERFVVVSGPNMGGKSTLLRQTCLAVILAQLGCFVPAKRCVLTPVDRIFTRVGANDRIMAGQSTFMVELEETATIVRHCTPKSLIILDELGRGTSTFDGSGIAYGTALELVACGCRCLFATHFHDLTEQLTRESAVCASHMSFAEEGGRLTFLYRFVRGICGESHGVHCAGLAGMDARFCQTARKKSDLLRIHEGCEDPPVYSADFCSV